MFMTIQHIPQLNNAPTPQADTVVCQCCDHNSHLNFLESSRCCRRRSHLSSVSEPFGLPTFTHAPHRFLPAKCTRCQPDWSFNHTACDGEAHQDQCIWYLSTCSAVDLAKPHLFVVTRQHHIITTASIAGHFVFHFRLVTLTFSPLFATFPHITDQ